MLALRQECLFLSYDTVIAYECYCKRAICSGDIFTGVTLIDKYNRQQIQTNNDIQYLFQHTILWYTI